MCPSIDSWESVANFAIIFGASSPYSGPSLAKSAFTVFLTLNPSSTSISFMFVWVLRIFSSFFIAFFVGSSAVTIITSCSGHLTPNCAFSLADKVD